MAIALTFEDKLAVIRSTGLLIRSETDDAKRQTARYIKRHGRISVLIVIEEGFLNLDAFASWDDIEEDETIQKNVDRLAIVGDLKWRDSALLFFLNGFVPFSIQYFKSGQEHFARAWLAS